MNLKSSLLFRIALGSIFVAQYFLGIDGHGLASGDVIILALGLLFIAFGLYGFFQREATRKRLAVNLGLPITASWDDIETAQIQQRMSKGQI